MLELTKPALILAPMEGVTDAPMRAVQGEIGAFTFAVSEFLRISHQVPPKHVFFRHVPELRNGSRTPSGLPVQVQLLGGDPGRMGEAAAVAHECGASAIDLNFGCPAKTVNRHDGGATLLKYPLRIRDIVHSVRSALPKHVPVSAKMRLGWDSIDPIEQNAAMAAEGGASWITIHGRTRLAGYAPPIFWRPIGRVRESLRIPVVANGDIWSVDDFRRCRDETGCMHFMLGRGALANPSLSHHAAEELGIARLPTSSVSLPGHWATHLQRLVRWMATDDRFSPERTVRRLKQWLKLAAVGGTFTGFDTIKRAKDIEELFALLPHGKMRIPPAEAFARQLSPLF
jgi:tRNA-dihydrouridine synthase C